MQESTFIERASERMWKCEGLFAESKQYHCLARAKYRGRSKVQIQAYLCAIVQNLKRLLFPLYGWLLTCWWRCKARGYEGMIKQSDEARNRPAKRQHKSDFFNRPVGLSALQIGRLDTNSTYVAKVPKLIASIKAPTTHRKLASREGQKAGQRQFIAVSIP